MDGAARHTAAWCALLSIGCSTQDAWPLRDEKGRECLRHVDAALECDASAMPSFACGAIAGWRPCFVLASVPVVDPAGLAYERVCEACCEGNGYAFTPQDCADVLCNADIDCAATRARCVFAARFDAGGVCVLDRDR